MSLDKQKQQIILDFYFRCGTEEDIVRGRDLIAASPEAARLYAGLEETLTELDSIKYEPCPDNLAELTIARLKLASSAGKVVTSEQLELKNLLDIESLKTANKSKVQTGPKFLRSFFEIAASAAALILIAGIIFPALSMMRMHSRQVACTNNMRSVGQALSSFFTDNTKNLDGVKVAAGSPWWKIGDQSSQPQSNTRLAWQLIQRGYVKPEMFLCSGHKEGCPVTPEQLLSQLQDFPSRNNISYSFIIFCDKTQPLDGRRRQVVMGDMNPVFRKIPTCGNRAYEQLNEFEKVFLNDQLKKISSPNHCGKGQNILYTDGSVIFIKQRVLNGDDIFTLQGVNEYKGVEIPCTENDVFLVP